MSPSLAARALAVLTLLLVPTLLGADEEESPAPPADATPAAYRTSGEVGRLLVDLAERAAAAGRPARVVRYGESAAGRPLLALRVGEEAPVVLAHGGLGRRDAAATAACLRLAERVLEEGGGVAWLLVPVPNPDALDGFLAGAWPGGGGDADRDGDGRRGEDGPADVDGDGEILRMRRPSPRGAWTPSAVPAAAERLLVRRRPDARRPVSYEVWDEGLDADADGEVGEDPPGLDLTRQMAGWWTDKAPWRGEGPFPGYAPETKALMDLSWSEAGLVAWYGFTGVGPRILRASEQGRAADADRGLYARVSRALTEAVGLPVQRASAVLGRERNPGSDLDWACVHLGVPAFRVPVWNVARQEGHERRRAVADEVDWLLWNDRVLEGRGFVAWRPFDHPTLGAVEIGGWRRFTRWEPPPDLLAASVERASAGPLVHARFRPRLRAVVEARAEGEGLYTVVLRALNAGDGPTNTAVAERHERAVGVRGRLVPAPGVELLAGPPLADLGRLEPGAVSEPVRWLVRGPGGGALGTIHLRHPAAGALAEEVRAP